MISHSNRRKMNKSTKGKLVGLIAMVGCHSPALQLAFRPRTHRVGEQRLFMTLPSSKMELYHAYKRWSKNFS